MWDMNHPSSGCPKYTIVTSVFPYTADTEGYNCVSFGKPRNATPEKRMQILG